MNEVALTVHVITTTRIFGVIALVAPLVAVSSLAYLHVAPTGVSPVRHAVSQYGITNVRAGYRAQTMAFGVSGAALAAAQAATFHGRGVRWLVVALLVSALARLVISWSPLDEPGAVRTATGQRHRILAIAAFVAVAIAVAHVSNMASATAWSRVATVSTLLAWLMGLTLLAMVLTRLDARRRGVFGAIERLFYLETIAWLGVIGVACVTLAR